jgi:hypothetical protein
MINDYNEDEYAQAAIVKLFQGGWDALTFLAEFPKLVSMFRGATLRLLNLLRSTDPRVWASAWLEGRYGWRLLWYDIRDIMGLLEDLIALEHEFYKATFGRSTSFYSKEQRWTASDQFWSCSWDTVVQGTVGIRGTATTKLRPEGISVSFLKTGWELVPFSFIIDWFIQVGQAIDALSALSVDFDYVCGVGHHAELIVHGEFNHTFNNGYHGSASGSSEGYYRHTQRKPVVPTAIPQLAWNISDFKVMDLIALMIQYMSRNRS